MYRWRVTFKFKIYIYIYIYVYQKQNVEYTIYMNVLDHSYLCVQPNLEVT